MCAMCTCSGSKILLNEYYGDFFAEKRVVEPFLRNTEDDAVTQPCSQCSLSSFEKEPWLRLVTWNCVSINCAVVVGPPLNFVDWTMKYYLG